MKIRPIKKLLDEVSVLSNDTNSNKEKLDNLRNLIINQKKLVNSISTSKIKNKLASSKLSYDEYNNCRDILKEKKNYKKYYDMIQCVIEKDYRGVHKINTMKKIRNNLVIVGTSVLLILSASKLSNYLKNKEDKKNNTTIEYSVDDKEKTTREITTEATTEMQTEATTEVTTETQTEATTEATTETQTEATTEATTETQTEATTEYIEFDDDFIFTEKADDFFNTMSSFDEKISSYEEIIIDPEKREDAKENVKREAKEKAIEYIDFIFYGKDINGVTFDELKQSGKDKAYAQLQKLDNIISKYDPDYLDNLGERYARLKGLGSTTFEKAKNKAKGIMGEDYYNQAGEVKDDIIDTLIDTGKILKKGGMEIINNFKDGEE